MAELIGFPNSTEIERFDGSKWRIFDLSNHGKLVLTTRGGNLFRNNSDLWRAINQYRHDIKDHTSSVRKYFRSGGNSDVYSVGEHPLLIKETFSAHSAWSSLDRMDYLYGICEGFMPPHINVPMHYGILFSQKMTRQYLLMHKVNDGTTVADVYNGIYPVKPSLRRTVLEEYDKAEMLIKRYIDTQLNQEECFTNLLPDWERNNVVVDFDQPIGTYPFSLWIIDQ